MHRGPVSSLSCRAERALAIAHYYCEAKIWDVARLAAFPPADAPRYVPTHVSDPGAAVAVASWAVDQRLQVRFGGALDWVSSHDEQIALACFLGFGVWGLALVVWRQFGARRR